MVVRLRYVYGLHRQDYELRDVPYAVARDLIERFHYAGGAGNTATVVHGLFHKEAPHYCLAVVCWLPPMRPAALWFAGPLWRHCLVLTRAVATPWAPPNSMSFLIAASIRRIRSLADRLGRPRWTHLLSFADEYRAEFPVAVRIPGGIYRAVNALRLGTTDARPTWVDDDGHMVSVYCAGVTRSQAAMLARGYHIAGRYRKWRYGWVLHPELCADDYLDDEVYTQPALLSA